MACANMIANSSAAYRHAGFPAPCRAGPSRFPAAPARNCAWNRPLSAEIVMRSTATASSVPTPEARRLQSPAAMDIGVVIIRFVSGVVLAAHGAQKILGWLDRKSVV